MTKRITAHDVQPAADGTTATEFEVRVPKEGDYWLRENGQLAGPIIQGHKPRLIALNPTRPRPDWEPPEWLKPGWVFLHEKGFWMWSAQKPERFEHGWSQCGGILNGIDTSDWPDVEPKHSLYECLGRRIDNPNAMCPRCKVGVDECWCGLQERRDE